MKALHPTPDSLADLYRFYLPEEAGKDGYAPEWHHTIKHAVRAEAGHRCERCGHPYRQGEHGKGEWSPCDSECRHSGPTRPMALVAKEDYNEAWRTEGGPIVKPGAPVLITQEAQWRILTVHHLDGVKLNCRWWNLAALCQRCHLEIQGRVRMGQIYPFEHSPWFKIHAAGFYAWVYLGEDLTREQATIRLEELLALERAV